MFEKEQHIAEQAQLLLNENFTTEEWKIPDSNYYLIFNLFHKVANISESTGTELYTTQLAA